MDLTTRLDLDLIAHETDESVSVLVEITAPRPEPDGSRSRPQHCLQVVLDRSGSMGGGRLHAARTALALVIDRLDPTDAFGVVAFDDRVEVAVPTGPLSDKAAAKRAVLGVHSRGSTDLSAGYLRGVQQARAVAGPAGATLLVVSDGHANAGIVDHDALADLAAGALAAGVRTSTLGVGLGYDEALLAALARAGSGNATFAADPDAAAAAITAEAEGLLDQAVTATSLTVGLTPLIRGVTVHNDLPTSTAPDGALVLEIGSLYAGETRRVLLTLDVPAVAAIGLAEVARLTLRWVETTGLVERSRTDAVCVNVVPGDAAAGRVPDPVVRTELAYQQAQQAKRTAVAALATGDLTTWERAMDAAATGLRAALPTAASIGADADLEEDLGWIESTLRRSQTGAEGVAYASRATYADYNRKSRQRGRRPSGSA